MPLQITSSTDVFQEYPFFNKCIEEVNLLFKKSKINFNLNIQLIHDKNEESRYDCIKDIIYVQDEHSIKTIKKSEDIEYTFAHELGHVVHDILMKKSKSFTLKNDEPISSLLDTMFPHKISADITGVKMFYQTISEGFADTFSAFMLLKHHENSKDIINKFLKKRKDDEITPEKLKKQIYHSTYITVPTVLNFISESDYESIDNMKTLSAAIMNQCVKTCVSKSLKIFQDIPSEHINMTVGYIAGAYNIKKAVFSVDKQEYYINEKLKNVGCHIDLLYEDKKITNDDRWFSFGNANYHIVSHRANNDKKLIISKKKIKI